VSNLTETWSGTLSGDFYNSSTQKFQNSKRDTASLFYNSGSELWSLQDVRMSVSGILYSQNQRQVTKILGFI